MLKCHSSGQLCGTIFLPVKASFSFIMTSKDREGSKTRYTVRERTHQLCAELQESRRKAYHCKHTDFK